jgi:phosphate transport system permease protein
MKPGFEIMEAVPSVVLGLVAAASIAPWLNTHVGSVLAAFTVLPCVLLAIGFACGRPLRADGWLPLYLLPVVVATFAATIALGERLPLQGPVPDSPWNAMLIGLALGIASTPFVFVVAEEALSQVPPSQRLAAAALGATRWQSLRSVVLPAAGPGLVAAGLLGFMRCFGETMIVLMASGNTPIGGADPLTGLRALAADIALGMPDAAPHSAAWRNLLASALALVGISLLASLIARRLREGLRSRLGAGARP